MTGVAALTPSSEARVVHGALDDVTVTEGPYAESVEQVSGFYTVATDDLDDVTVTEGPYAESVEQVSGFYTVATDDLDDLLKICGLLSATGFHDVEVRAFLPLDMG